MQQLVPLWRYQQVDMKASVIENKLRNSEVRKKLLRARNYLMESQQNLKKLEADANGLQVSYDTAMVKTREYAQRIDDIIREMHQGEDTANLADVERMRKEINDLRDQLTRQEQAVQSIMESLTHIDDTMRKLYTGIPKAKNDFDQLKKLYDNEAVAATREIEPFRKEMQEMEKTLDPQLLAKYKAIKKTRVNPIALAMNGQCMGCNMELPSIARKKLMYNSPTLCECDNCGRLLFVRNDAE